MCLGGAMVSVLAAMFILSARTWVRVPLTTSSFSPVRRFLHSTTELTTLTSVPYAPTN